MRRTILIIVMLVLLQSTSQAAFRFGVGLNWFGEMDLGMGMGFDMGVGWKEFGVDLSHYGVQPTLHRFGTLEINHDRLGIYYQPVDFFLLQAGIHSTIMTLDTNAREVLGVRESVAWSGPYVILSAPIRIEQTYFIKPFWGLLSVDRGSRTEAVFGISLGAEFDPDKDKIFF